MPLNCGAGEVSSKSLGHKEIKLVNLKGNQHWILTEDEDMLKMKLQYFGPLMRTANSLEKSLMLGKLRAEEEGIRGWDGWMASSMQWTWTWANFGRWGGTGRPGVLQSMRSPRVRHDWVTEQQQSCKEIKPINPKRNQPWTFIGRTDPEVEAPILWPPDAKSWLIVKIHDAGKDRGPREKRASEDEMAGWHQ